MNMDVCPVPPWNAMKVAHNSKKKGNHGSYRGEWGNPEHLFFEAYNLTLKQDRYKDNITYIKWKDQSNFCHHV